MLRKLLRSKIHKATVTGADLNYEGSITIDETLMKAADLVEHEKVHVLNLNTGSRAETYVIRGEPDSGAIIMNGAIARLAQIGDPVIILAYGFFQEDESPFPSPKIVLLDEKNRITGIFD
jgi:aspartate 1-decarboxylase